MKKRIKERLKKIIKRIEYYKKYVYDGIEHNRKEKIVKCYSKKIKANTFIETGTYRGDMINAVWANFTWLFSIELSKELFQKCKKRFWDKNNVYLYCGDSGDLISTVIKDAIRIGGGIEQTKIVFWLDGHYSYGETAKGDLETPILKELNGIFDVLSNSKNYVICIDDARLFNGLNDYPSIEVLKKFISSFGEFTIEIEKDVIRVLPISIF